MNLYIESSITYGPSLASGGLNERQSQALHYILDGSLAQEDCLSPPYIIFGPPGTGKTTTVVEAIYQLFRKSNTRILACCPSNSACDLIIERLSAFITTHDMIRVNSFNRDYNAISGLVMEYSIYDKTKGGFFLNNAKIRQRKVVVCTLATSAKLYHDGIYSNEFSHVFIDEAGHAIEQEAILPIVNLFDSSDGTNRVILAGDPKQLGPVIQSTLAKRMGEDISFLERLINTIQIYSRSDDYEEFGCYNPQVMTKLVRNYRSHPDIIHCPNALFYDNDLIPCADPAITERLLHFSELPNPNSPIVVCGVQGMEARERGSPSWFNAQEISVVVEWVNKLMTTRDVSERDIGIISPYAKQVSKLRKELERQGRLSVDVGSVEQFQGQEKDIIIVSTVRSSHEFEDFDLKFHLGFLKNAKRFNVAVTRAKCLFILIGNPEVLLIDRCWGNLTQWAINNRAYTGCSLPVDLSSSPGSTDLDEQQRFQLLMDNAMSFLQQWRLGVETQSEDASTSDSEGKSD